MVSPLLSLRSVRFPRFSVWFSCARVPRSSQFSSTVWFGSCALRYLATRLTNAFYVKRKNTYSPTTNRHRSTYPIPCRFFPQRAPTAKLLKLIPAATFPLLPRTRFSLPGSLVWFSPPTACLLLQLALHTTAPLCRAAKRAEPSFSFLQPPSIYLANAAAASTYSLPKASALNLPLSFGFLPAYTYPAYLLRHAHPKLLREKAFCARAATPTTYVRVPFYLLPPVCRSLVYVPRRTRARAHTARTGVWFVGRSFHHTATTALAFAFWRFVLRSVGFLLIF